MDAVCDRGMRADDMMIPIGFVGINNRFAVCELMDMRLQDFVGRVRNDAQTNLTAFTSNRANNQWAVIGIRPAPTLTICTITWWIQRIVMFFAFFPAF